MVERQIYIIKVKVQGGKSLRDDKSRMVEGARTRGKEDGRGSNQRSVVGANEVARKETERETDPGEERDFRSGRKWLRSGN